MTLDEFIKKYVAEDTLLFVWSRKGDEDIPDIDNLDIDDTYSSRKFYYTGANSLLDYRSYDDVKDHEVVCLATSYDGMLYIQVKYDKD